MKKVLLSFLLLIALLINYELIFAVEISPIDSDEVGLFESTLEDILVRRSELWNSLFSEGTNMEYIFKELETVISDPLLTYDIEAFTELKNDPTNMDEIKDVDVKKIKNIEVTEDEAFMDVNIEWLMEGLDGKYTENISYRMCLVYNNNKWILSDYTVK